MNADSTMQNAHQNYPNTQNNGNAIDLQNNPQVQQLLTQQKIEFQQEMQYLMQNMRQNILQEMQEHNQQEQNAPQAPI
ncbi:hypothetical protein CQA53_05700 [Helicobacter didelphidarum]|uniref:Uncharacterized protein n=2 Tax=Helicobacter didelphidarum TaxID=2040648 RepID=A0A3D8IKA8_9HELI|nr:hypothetical protein CQA53_05700 [Helicobacter didelphidarum]